MNSYCGITQEWLEENIRKLETKAQNDKIKKNLAANKIQRKYLQWRTYKMFKKYRNSIIIIQKFIRRFIARKIYRKFIEEYKRKEYDNKLHGAAIIIQKYIRGYLSRKYIHDHRKLRELQLNNARELIECIAYKVEHILRTKQIAGILSLKNNHCLPKVEELLSSLKYKRYNEFVRYKHELEKRRIVQALSGKKIQIPYPSNACVHTNITDDDRYQLKSIESFRESSAEQRQSFEEDQYDNEFSARRISRYLYPSKCNYPCYDLSECMKRWCGAEDCTRKTD